MELVFKNWISCPRFTVPPNRVKPWGTNHAVMMAKDVIDEPFAVINADDFMDGKVFNFWEIFFLRFMTVKICMLW